MLFRGRGPRVRAGSGGNWFGGYVRRPGRRRAPGGFCGRARHGTVKTVSRSPGDIPGSALGVGQSLGAIASEWLFVDGLALGNALVAPTLLFSGRSPSQQCAKPQPPHSRHGRPSGARWPRQVGQIMSVEAPCLQGTMPPKPSCSPGRRHHRNQLSSLDQKPAETRLPA